MSEGGLTAIEEALRLQPTWNNGGVDLPGPGGLPHRRRHGRRAGSAATSCASAPSGSRPTPRWPRRASGGAAAASERVSGPMQEWRAPFGALSAANWIGMHANQYLHRYGATREMLGTIALTGAANAGRNPAPPSTENR